MKTRIRRSLPVVLAAVLTLPVAAVLFLCLTAGTSRAGDDDVRWQVGSFGDVFAGGDGAFLGVHLDDDSDSEDGGARVTRVVPDSAADEAGLEVGDLIVELDGQSVSGPMGLSELVGSKEVGDRVELNVFRDGRELTLDAELGERDRGFGAMSAPEAFSVLGCEDDDDCSFSFDFDCEGDDCEGFNWSMHRFASKPLLGVELIEMTPELRVHMGAEADEGVLVGRVVEESAAEGGGIEVGDVIVAVDGRRIDDVGDLRRVLSRRAGERIDVDVVRDGAAISLDVTLPEAEEFDRSMMHLPDGFGDAITEYVREALGDARAELDRSRFEEASALKKLRRAMDQVRRAQRDARRQG